MIPVQARTIGSGCLGKAKGCKCATDMWPEWAERYLKSHFINLNLASWSESISATQLDIFFSNAKGTQNSLIQGLVSLLVFKLLISSLFCPGYSLQLERFLEYSVAAFWYHLGFNHAQNRERNPGGETWSSKAASVTFGCSSVSLRSMFDRPSSC